MIDAQKALEGALITKLQPLFDKCHNCIMEYKDVMEQHHFSEGFKAGILFGLQIKGHPPIIIEDGK